MYGIVSHVVDGDGGLATSLLGPGNRKVCDNFREFDQPNPRLVITVATVEKLKFLG